MRAEANRAERGARAWILPVGHSERHARCTAAPLLRGVRVLAIRHEIPAFYPEQSIE
jgi:hypothetical protein